MIAPDGTVSTFAGTETADSIDGPVTTARFIGSAGITVDPATHALYVVDGSTIRKIAQGAVTTVVGVEGQHGVQPGPLPGSLNSPADLAWIGNSSLLIFDAKEAVVLEAVLP